MPYKRFAGVLDIFLSQLCANFLRFRIFQQLQTDALIELVPSGRFAFRYL